MRFVQQLHMLSRIRPKILVEWTPDVIGINRVGLRVIIAGHVAKENSNA